MPTGTKSQKAAKRRVVAAGAIAGKPTRAVAEKAGCSARHVNRLAEEPETQELIQSALAPYTSKLRRMAGKAVRAVERGLIAQKTSRSDHVMQLRAVERYGDLLELAAGQNRSGSSGVTLTNNLQILTYEQFCCEEAEHERTVQGN